MSEATKRGLGIFALLVAVTAFGCYLFPFVVLPGAGLGVGLPIITLKTEALLPNFVIPGFDLTNTLTSMFLVDAIVLLIGFAVRRAVSAQAPDRFVPRRFVNFIEIIVEFWYNQARNVLGEHTRRVLPLALTIFTFVLVGNWIKLIPGVETVGIIVCAESGFPGYPLKGNGPFLEVKGGSLQERAGAKTTTADAHACEEKHPQFTPPGVIAARQRGQVKPGTEEHAPASGTAPATKPATQPATGAALATDHLTSIKTGDESSSTSNAAAGNPDLFTVIPFFRPLATDLNMPLALAIIVFTAVQVWGIQALGAPYFYKFINIPALGNLKKNPMGVMDFIVGLVDIISELSRLISLSFRLLGNIFAGGILLAVMSFLVAFVLPIVFYGLELFVGLIQAYVFAILTVMYASQAVTAHHAEEHDESHVEYAAEQAQPVE